MRTYRSVVFGSQPASLPAVGRRVPCDGGARGTSANSVQRADGDVPDTNN
jgi:hypothetical protein